MDTETNLDIDLEAVESLDPGFNYDGVKAKFEESLNKLLVQMGPERRKNKFLTEREIAEIKNIILTGKKKPSMLSETMSQEDIEWCFSTFEVCRYQCKLILIIKRNNTSKTFRRVVAYDKFFYLISRVHRAHGHERSSSKISEVLSKRYYIPIICIEMLENVCNICNGDEIKAFNYRIYIEVVGMTDCQQTDFDCVLIYLDLVTRYLILKPVPANTIEHIGTELIQIFCDFGVPNKILCQQEDIEPMDQVLKYVKHIHPDFCVLLDQTNKTHIKVDQIKNNIKHWMTTNETHHWAMGCGYVQWLHNTTDVGGISPYKAVFHIEPNRSNNDLNDDTMFDLERDDADLDVGIQPSVIKKNVSDLSNEAQSCSSEKMESNEDEDITIVIDPQDSGPSTFLFIEPTPNRLEPELEDDDSGPSNDTNPSIIITESCNVCKKTLVGNDKDCVCTRCEQRIHLDCISNTYSYGNITDYLCQLCDKRKQPKKRKKKT